MLHLLKFPSRQKAFAQSESHTNFVIQVRFIAEMHFGKCIAALIKLIFQRAKMIANPLLLFIQFDSVARPDAVSFVYVWQ